MAKYISQQDWVNAIMKLVYNLDDDGKEQLYIEVEKEVFFHQETREELENKISDLEDTITDLEYDKELLESRIADLEKE